MFNVLGINTTLLPRDTFTTLIHSINIYAAAGTKAIWLPADSSVTQSLFSCSCEIYYQQESGAFHLRCFITLSKCQKNHLKMLMSVIITFLYVHFDNLLNSPKTTRFFLKSRLITSLCATLNKSNMGLSIRMLHWTMHLFQ